MFVKKIAFAAILVASAYAQTETSSSPLPTSSLSACLLNCANSATQCTLTDASCVCVNTDYQTAVLQCLQQSCTADDVAAAEALQASLCGSSSSSFPSSSLSSALSSVASSVSSRVSSVSSRVSSISSSRSSVAANPTSTTGGSGGAAGLSASLLATGGAVLLGVIGGGLLVF